MKQIPLAFIDRFVLKAMRERVAHEWIKKPEKLHYRVCHKADELFVPESKDQYVEFSPKEPVLVLGFGSNNHEKDTLYAEAEKRLGFGGGILIISTDGHKFIAETEAVMGRPSVTYAGSDKS